MPDQGKRHQAPPDQDSAGRRRRTSQTDHSGVPAAAPPSGQRPGHRPDQAGLGKPRPAQAGRDQTGRTWADQARTDPSQTDQNQPGQARADQARTDQNQTGQARTDQARADQNQTDQARADQARADQNQTDRTRADQGRTDQGRAGWAGTARPLRRPSDPADRGVARAELTGVESARSRHVFLAQAGRSDRSPAAVAVRSAPARVVAEEQASLPAAPAPEAGRPAAGSHRPAAGPARNQERTAPVRWPAWVATAAAAAAGR
jgi:hypothetical protein